MTRIKLSIRSIGVLLAGMALAAPSQPALGQAISGVSITKNMANDADSASNPSLETSIRFERKTTVAIQGSAPSSFTTRYAEGIGVDTGDQTHSLTQNSSYAIQFTVTSPTTYFVTVDTKLQGDLNLKDDSAGSASAGFSAVNGSHSGGSLSSGSLGIAAPGTLSGSNGPNQPFSTLQSARIDGTSNGAPVVHTLTFTWNASCTSTGGDECGVRLGLPINLNLFTAGNYAGNPARAQGNDGHFVTVTLHPCGDGILDSGESCDAGALNGQPGSCCSTACQYIDATVQCRASAGACDPAEVCDGLSGICPDDAKSESECRAATSECDVPEICDGSSNDCPADVVVMNGSNCSAPCFTGAQCMGGACIGGAPVVCSPVNGCPQACNVESNSCENDPTVESHPCMTCDDTIDNDSDDDIDADDANCSTLSEYQHFALLGRIVKGKSVVLGSAVAVKSNLPGSHSPGDPPFPSGQSRGGVCTNNQAQMITTVQIAGAVAAADAAKVRFGTGQDINIGTTYAVGPTTNTVLTGTAPVVGPGNCNDGGMAACTLDAQCTFPATCEGLKINDITNPNVDKTGTHEEFTRCATAKANLLGDEAYLYALSISNPAYDLGPIKHDIGASQPIPSLSGPGPHILKANKVRVAPGAVLTITADDPDAVVVIQVDRSISIGKTATVQVGGALQARNLLWVGHGKGSVKINGSATFAGTVVAPERSIKLGQNITVQGALLGNKVSIAGATSLTHLPFTPLL